MIHFNVKAHVQTMAFNAIILELQVETLALHAKMQQTAQDNMVLAALLINA